MRELLRCNEMFCLQEICLKSRSGTKPHTYIRHVFILRSIEKENTFSEIYKSNIVKKYFHWTISSEKNLAERQRPFYNEKSTQQSTDSDLFFLQKKCNCKTVQKHRLVQNFHWTSESARRYDRPTDTVCVQVSPPIGVRVNASYVRFSCRLIRIIIVRLLIIDLNT